MVKELELAASACELLGFVLTQVLWETRAQLCLGDTAEGHELYKNII